MSDEELALSLKKRKNAATFDELVRRHQGRVYAVAFRITGNREDALDVAQEALVKAFRKIEMWEPRSQFAAWLMRLTSNQAIDSVRRRNRRRHESLDARPDSDALESRAEPSAAAAALDPERHVRAQEIDARVQQAMEVLSPSQRAVFAMRHYEGLQLAEIAEALGCTVGSVKVHLFRALKKMQVELADLHADS